MAFSGADPATYKAGLTALVGSAGMTPVGVSGGSGGGDCVSTAMTLDNGEAAAAAQTGAAATLFSATEEQQQRQRQRGRQAGVVGPTVAPASGCSSSSSSSYSGSCEGGEAVDEDEDKDDGNRENRAPPGTAAAAAAAAAATTASAASGGGGGGDDNRGRGAPVAPAVACVPRPPRIDTEAATSRGTVVVGGVVVPPPPLASVPAGGGGGGGGRKAGGSIRTLGMMREESARRAQGLGSMYGIHGLGTVKSASVSGGESAPAVTDANTNANTTNGGGGGGGGAPGLPSSFLAKGLKGAGGRDVSLGSSSTTSISSGTPSISTPRARVRSYNENELYGTWFA